MGCAFLTHRQGASLAVLVESWAVALPEEQLPSVRTAITPTAPITPGLARGTVVCPSG